MAARGFRGKAGKAGMKNPERAASRRILHSPLWRLPSAAVRIGLPGNTGTGTCERIRCTICNAGTDEIFPRRICAEIFRLSPYCLARAIWTAVFRTKHQPAIRGQIKEFGQTRSPLRFFHFLPGSNVPVFCEIGFLEGIKNRSGCKARCNLQRGDGLLFPRRSYAERRPRRPEFSKVHCGGYGAMPSGLVFRGNTGTDGTFPRKCGAKMSRQSPHCSVG